MPTYRKYWNESILVIVLPAGHFFYAQYMDKLKLREDNTYDLNKEFVWLEEIFTKVNLDILYSYKRQIIDFWNRQREHYDPINTNLDRFNLYRLIQQLPECDVDELFHEFGRRNLVSRGAFNEALKELIDDRKIIEKDGKIVLV